MNKSITFLSLFYIFIFGLLIQTFAQQNQIVNNLSVETPLISAGAENSILIEELKLLGNNSLEYDGNATISIATESYSSQSANFISTIEGINFDEDASLNSSYHIPPDPSGAIGPNHLVSVTNTSIEWFTKAGTQINSQSLSSFFTSLSPLTSTFDPKVLYDQYANRFVVVTLERTVGTPNTSNIFLAVSQTSDPTGGWYFHSINSVVSINLGFGAGPENFWADYPGFSVGTDAIYITNNMFSYAANTFGGVRLWIVDKGVSSGFYSGAAASVSIVDPIAVSGGGIATTLQPAHMFGTVTAGLGTYLVAHSGLNNGVISYIEIFSVSNALPIPVITFLGYLSLGAVDSYPLTDTPLAPQAGTTIGVSTNDRRAYNAVWRNDNLYVSSILVPPSGPDAGQTTAHWIQVNTISGTLVDQGNIGGEDVAPGTYTFFPSIAVNANDEIMVGFAASAPTIFPGAYYTFRFPADPAGTVQSTKTLKAGLDYYNRKFSGTRNRWGDYSGSSIDPVNDITFCIFNEYALDRGTILSSYPTQDGRWGTAFGVMPSLDLTILLEGPYSGSGAMTTFTTEPLTQPYNVAPWNYQGKESIPADLPNIFDWVLVTLRKDLDSASPDPLTAVDVVSRAGLINISGKIYDLDGIHPLSFNVESGDYYVVVQHRNHLAVMSPTAITIN